MNEFIRKTGHVAHSGCNAFKNVVSKFLRTALLNPDVNVDSLIKFCVISPVTNSIFFLKFSPTIKEIIGH